MQAVTLDRVAGSQSARVFKTSCTRPGETAGAVETRPNTTSSTCSPCSPARGAYDQTSEVPASNLSSSCSPNPGSPLAADAIAPCSGSEMSRCSSRLLCAELRPQADRHRLSHLHGRTRLCDARRNTVTGTQPGVGQRVRRAGQKFQPMVDALNEVSETRTPIPKDILRLYEVWLKTGSRAATTSSSAWASIRRPPRHAFAGGTAFAH